MEVFNRRRSGAPSRGKIQNLALHLIYQYRRGMSVICLVFLCGIIVQRGRVETQVDGIRRVDNDNCRGYNLMQQMLFPFGSCCPPGRPFYALFPARPGADCSMVGDNLSPRTIIPVHEGAPYTGMHVSSPKKIRVDCLSRSAAHTLYDQPPSK